MNDATAIERYEQYRAGIFTESEFIDYINQMNHTARVIIRQQMDKLGLPIPRNLFYDYSAQCWID